MPRIGLHSIDANDGLNPVYDVGTGVAGAGREMDRSIRCDATPSSVPVTRATPFLSARLRQSLQSMNGSFAPKYDSIRLFAAKTANSTRMRLRQSIRSEERSISSLRIDDQQVGVVGVDHDK